MRTCAWIVAGLAIVVPPGARALAQTPSRSGPASAEAAASPSRAALAPPPRSRAGPSPKPYEGVWGGDSQKACRDPDGVDRMLIERDRLEWYETRCRASAIRAEGPRSWAMRLSCEGEGRRFRANPRLRLAAPDRLIMDDAPVGPTKRQVYVRCAGR
jgi:hypothetical protein